MIEVEETDCLVTTNGMFIIDKIVNKEENIIDENIPGGGGLFSTVGSTMVVSSNNKNIPFPKEVLLPKVKFIVDCGRDFPYDEICPTLNTWNVGIKYREDKNRLTTRGLNEYSGNYRTFKYETPKLQILGSDLSQLTSKDLCTLEYLPSVLEILEFYSVSKGFKIVVSPNSEEFLQLVQGGDVMMDPTLELIKGVYLKSKDLLFKNQNHKFVIRCGKLGCLYPQDDNSFVHFPAYHDKSSSEKIVDATGCGNSFLGAFSTTLLLTDFDYHLACVFGNIASGIVLESKGLPEKTEEVNDGNPIVLWNGLSFNERLNYYLKKYSL
ncbi:unnamed protein product [Hanseniaspora opuntiae]